MTRLLFIALIVGVYALAFIPGCIFKTETDPPIPPKLAYEPLTEPQNLVNNLEVSYRRKEIERYAELLHPEFIFRFQPTDFQEVGVETWNRNTDSLKTERLFSTPLVSGITIDISAFTPPAPPVDPDPELEGTTFIRVNRTFLEVDQTDGITWQVDGDIQDLFFVRGDGVVTDSTRWYLLEWRDISGNSARSPVLLSDGAEERRPASHTSWGLLRARFDDE